MIKPCLLVNRGNANMPLDSIDIRRSIESASTPTLVSSDNMKVK